MRRRSPNSPSAAVLTRTRPEASLRRLHDAHALLLHPRQMRALGRPSVRAVARILLGGDCAARLLGELPLLRPRHRRRASLATRGSRPGSAARARPGSFGSRRRAASTRDGVFHLSTPVARWWDNVIHACASFQPFASEADVDPWCERHALPRGAVMTIPPRCGASPPTGTAAISTSPGGSGSPEEVRALFERHGLTGPFWDDQFLRKA